MHPRSEATPGAPAPKLSADLHELAGRFRDHPVSIGEIMETLGARASALLVVVCALPFCSPITLPGMSTPFGFVIFFLALRFALGLPPWLPGRLSAVVLPPRFFAKVLEAGSRLIGWIERRLDPRWTTLVDAPWKFRLHAAAICAAALLLMIPLPPFPPLTNTLPALTIVVLAMSAIERDGAGIAAGYALLAGTVGYLAFWAAVVGESIERIGGALAR